MKLRINNPLVICQLVNSLAIAACFVFTIILFSKLTTVKHELLEELTNHDHGMQLGGGDDSVGFDNEGAGNDVDGIGGHLQSGSWSQLVRSVKPSIFRILLTDEDSLVGSGSGFCVGRDLIVTNSHVVMNDNNEIEEHVFVVDYEGGLLPVHGIAHRDSARDIAILLLKNKLSKNRVLPLLKGNPRYTSDLQQGDELAAIGHPLGLDFSLSTGNLSGFRSSSDLADELNRSVEGIWLQHTAPISPGNSGGPLFNRKGQVVGMNTLHILRKFGRAQNLNFAVSAKDILSAVENARNSDFTPTNEPPEWLKFYVKSQL